MVQNVRDVQTFRTKEEAYKRQEELRKLNKNLIPSDIRVASNTQRIQDPLTNILRNANAAITSSMRNIAVSRAIRDQVRLGMAKRMEKGAVQSSPTPEQIGVRVNGETMWFKSEDRLLFNSLQAPADGRNPFFMSIMTTPANVLRELITKSPDFMVANLVRDTISAWATSGQNVWPIIGTTLGFVQAVGGTSAADSLRASGVFGGYDFKNDPRDAMRSLKKYMRKGVAGAGSAEDYLLKGWIPSLTSPVAPLTKLWQFADDVTVASDMATRIAVYNRVLRETGNEAQAAYEALEVINFSRKGASKTVQYLTAVVPFLNARLEGLDVL